MSSHATITAKLANGTFAAIYLHSDGYDSHAGKTLRTHYNTQAKVEALVALGNLSTLDRDCTAPAGHSFKTPTRGHTVAYHRDRGEAWHQNAPATGGTADRAADAHPYGIQACVYVWQDGAWTFTDAENE